MKVINWLRRELGFYRHTPYQRKYLNDTNIRTSIYMSVVILALETWMIIRYVDERPGRTFLQYFDGETNYLILFSCGLITFSFALSKNRHSIRKNLHVPGVLVALFVIALDIVMIARYAYVNHASQSTNSLLWSMKYLFLLIILALGYLYYETSVYKKEDKHSAIYGQYLNVVFALICLGFGIETSAYDVSKERQILCFVTMVIYVACLLIWKPYVSMIVLSGSFLYFWHKWAPIMKASDSPYAQKILDANRINFFTFWIALTMISFSIYQQRLEEAKKDENLIAINERLKKIAVIDDLTGIGNMHQFSPDALDVLSRKDNQIYLFLNIENFKNYNDQFGYQAGNEYLKETAAAICKYFPGDPVARQGDDHFVVLTDILGHRERIDQLRDDLMNRNTEIYMDIKTGAYLPPEKDLDPWIAVDRARYAAGLIKNLYDKSYKEYNDKVDQDFHRRQYIVNNIDSAVEKGYIKVFYQPVVWSKDHKLCGCEALARWDDPEFGFLSPGAFIPVLEEYRLIHKLDKCIFETVCRDLRESMDKGWNVVPVSLNFSRLDFELMDAVSVMMELTEKYNIPKHLLHVEITESSLTDNMDILQDAMAKFKEAGFALWLDDFGSGYSSLNVLKDYSFDVLKIDMKFLSNFEGSDKAKTILRTIVNLASDIGMRSLTEGVETEEQAAFLREVGCGRLQGYYFGKPMPHEALAEKIGKGEYVIGESE